MSPRSSADLKRPERDPEAHPRRLGTIKIFTFKEGLLSRLAHDLCLSVRQFDIELQAGHVRAQADVASTRVDGIVTGERVDSSRFSTKDTEMIERNMRAAILNAARWPLVTFEGDVRALGVERWVVSGRLTMVGRTHEIEVPVVRAGSELRAEFDIKPSQWGIPAFTTMGGAIGIQDRWRVRAEFGLDGRAPRDLLRQEEAHHWGPVPA